MLRPGRQGWVLLLVASTVAGCEGFRPVAESLPETGPEGKTRVGLSFVRRKRTVEARGRFRHGAFEADRLEIEEPSKRVMLKGRLDRLDAEGGSVGGVRFRRLKTSVIRDEAGHPLAAAAVPAGAWVKVECAYRGGERRLRKLTVRHRRPGEQPQLQGRVRHVRLARNRFEIGGVRVTFPPDVPVVWDVEATPPPPRELRFAALMEQTHSGLRRVHRIDEEDRRPEKQLTIGRFLTVGGEVQYDLRWRRNHDLLTRKKRDRLIHQPSAKLELSADISRNLFAFTQVRLYRKIIQFDGEKDLNYNTQLEPTEAYLLLTDLPVRGLALQIGRQRFDHGREWVMDDELDAARLYLNLRHAILELSASTVLRNTTPEEDRVKNFLAGLHAEPLVDQELFLYLLHRRGGSLIDLARTHAGLTLEGEAGAFTYWLDAALVYGREDRVRVSGYGADAAAMYVFEDAPLEPSLYAGLAFGSGDGHPGPTDRNFRQTGLNDNNDRFNGVTSFRYLGELVRPEVSNLVVATAGAGLRPLRRTSLDVLVHHYRQVDRSPAMRYTRLRLDPKGGDRRLGYEIDVVLGFDLIRPVDVEAVFAYFHPGPAFGPSATDALFATLQVEYNF